MAYTIEFSAPQRTRCRPNRRVHSRRLPGERLSLAGRRLHERLQSLTRMPEAWGLAPENEFSRHEVRQMLFRNYRILFAVRERTVFIQTVRHGAREFLDADELDAIE